MKQLPWCDPLELLRGCIAEGFEDVACLYSGMRTGYSGRYSYLAFGVNKRLEGDDWTLLERCTHAGALPHHFGVINYEMLHSIESVATTAPSYINSPPISFIAFNHVLRFDHDTNTLIYEGSDPALIPKPVARDKETLTPTPATLTPAIAKPDYLNIVEQTIEEIRAGNFYQANITNKYCGTFDAPLTLHDACNLFTKLTTISPAPYSAFFSNQGRYTISSSPELFLQLDHSGTVTTRPIKGTAPKNQKADALHNSSKDRAENLMIVDLMRNDLSRCAVSGSVSVPELFDVDSFATLHHLSSTITATMQPDATLSDLVRATFPPGSMTGAPKRAAMRWIAEQENQDRGIYSGALGWVHGNQCELSVVIRTLIAEGNKCEFQVGGGIVADSDPEKEYQETLTKARAICELLGIGLNT